MENQGNSENVTKEKPIEKEETAEKLSHFWDKMAKEILQKYPELILPFLNVLFDKHYGKKTKIQFLNSEHVVKDAEGNTHTVQSDLVLLVNGQDLYHIEFQRIKDHDISCRFLEYDIGITLKSGTVRKKLTQREKECGLQKSNEFLHTRPMPVLVNLTHAIQEPDLYESTIKDGKGNEWIYTIQVVNVQKFTLEEIEALGYDLLIPFLPIKVWEAFDRRKKNEENTKDTVDKLVDILKKSRNILQDREERPYTSPGAAKELWESLRGACTYLFQKYPDVLREARKYMGDDFYFWDDRLEMEKKKVAVLEEKERNLQIEKESLRTEKEEINRSWQIQYNDLQIENESLQIEKEEINRNWQIQYNDLQIENESLQTEKESLQTEKDDLQKELKKREEELEMLRKNNHRFLRFVRNWKEFMF